MCWSDSEAPRTVYRTGDLSLALWCSIDACKAQGQNQEEISGYVTGKYPKGADMHSLRHRPNVSEGEDHAVILNEKNLALKKPTPKPPQFPALFSFQGGPAEEESEIITFLLLGN